MVPQERDLITTLLARLKSTAGQPKDPEADTLIRQAAAEQPDAPYYLVQTVLIQDLSLHQAQNRIAELEKQLVDAQASKPTSFLGSLFGTSQPASPPATSTPSAGPWSRSPQVAGPPPQQGYAQPGYAPQQQGYAPGGGGMMGGGMMGGMGGGGSSFLRSAAATAAGVAGGALLFQGISSMFGHGYASGLNGGMGMTPGLGETVVNNYYGDSGSGAGGSYGGGSDAGYSGGGDYGGGGDSGSSGGDYGSSSGGDYGGGGDYSGGGGGGDYGGGGDSGGGSSSC
jgi:hypothetical protein